LQSQRNDNLKEHGIYSEFFFPIIILDGLLFEARIEKGQLDLIERKHLQLRTDNDDGIFIIDIVIKDYFEKFFRQIENDHKEFVKSIEKIKFPKSYKNLLKTKITESKKERLPLPVELYASIIKEEK